MKMVFHCPACGRNEVVEFYGRQGKLRPQAEREARARSLLGLMDSLLGSGEPGQDHTCRCGARSRLFYDPAQQGGSQAASDTSDSVPGHCRVCGEHADHLHFGRYCSRFCYDEAKGAR